MKAVAHLLTFQEANKLMRRIAKMLVDADENDILLITHLVMKHPVFTNTPEVADNMIIASPVAQWLDPSEVSLPFAPSELDEIVDSFEKVE